jgi:hypothetical protein
MDETDRRTMNGDRSGPRLSAGDERHEFLLFFVIYFFCHSDGFLGDKGAIIDAFVAVDGTWARGR